MTPEELKAIVDAVSAKVAPAATAPAPAATAGWTEQARSANAGKATRVARKPVAPAAKPKTLDEALAQIEALRANRHTISLKVSEKGCVSVYGIGRFPVSLYSSQMTALLDASDAIRAFMVAHKAELTARE